MNRPITQEETQQLFEFCQKHYVYQYDVQVELVDHLASIIEEQWVEKPEISFEQALLTTFRKFGVMGFSKVKTEKEKALRKKYNRILWKYLLEFYEFPKVIMTFVFSMVLFTLLKLVNNSLWVLVPFFSILTLAIIYYYYWLFPKEYKIKTNPDKSFMLLNQLKRVQFLALIAIQLPIHTINLIRIFQLDFLLNNYFGLFGICLLVITFTIACYGQLIYVPEKIKEHFLEQFGEFAL